jgi:hypothetical protein
VTSLTSATLLTTTVPPERRMELADLFGDCLRDPLRFAVLAYLLGSVVCGAWALAVMPLRLVRRRPGLGAGFVSCWAVD